MPTGCTGHAGRAGAGETGRRDRRLGQDRRVRAPRKVRHCALRAGNRHDDGRHPSLVRVPTVRARAGRHQHRRDHHDHGGQPGREPGRDGASGLHPSRALPRMGNRRQRDPVPAAPTCVRDCRQRDGNCTGKIRGRDGAWNHCRVPYFGAAFRLALVAEQGACDAGRRARGLSRDDGARGGDRWSALPVSYGCESQTQRRIPCCGRRLASFKRRPASAAAHRGWKRPSDSQFHHWTVQACPPL